MDYEKLKETYSKHKNTYKLVKRNDKAAMYAQYMDNDFLIGYEVFCVKVQPEFTFPNGTVNPAKEAFPSNESFGNWAWCYKTLPSADKRYNEITEGIMRPVKEEKETEVIENKPKRKKGRPRKLNKINKPTVKKPREKFVWEGQEYNSKSEVARILLTNGESKDSIARKLKITVQTVHAVFKKMK